LIDARGTLEDAIGPLNDIFGDLGYVIIGVFAATWLLSVLIYRANRYDDLEVKAQA
jgi:high-affinity nickel-transport protein